MNANAPAALAQIGLPPADQICFVVKDLAAAVALYEPLFGPFTVLDSEIGRAHV